MTIEELKIQYANEILSSRDKEKATIEILSKIDTLKYTSGARLSDQDKKNLIDGITDLLTMKDRDGRRLSLCEKENITYLSMLSSVSNELAKMNGGK